MEKCLAVIASCTTLEQWRGAKRYVKLYMRAFDGYGLDTKLWDKYDELKGRKRRVIV